jgi:hypothetical protein
MEILTRRIGRSKGPKYTAYIYTKEEADSLGIEYLGWRDKEVKPGDWVLTDDNYVGQVRDIRQYGNKQKQPKNFILTTFGCQWVAPTNKLTWEDRRETGDYFNPIPRDWIKKEIARARTKRTVQLYANMMLTGRIDLQILGKAYRPDSSDPIRTVKKLLKREQVKSMIDQELQRILEEKGITKQFVVEKIVKAIELGEAKGDGYLLLKGADKMADYLEMQPGKTKVTEQIESNTIFKSIGDAIEKSDQLKLTRSKEIPALTVHATSQIEKAEAILPKEEYEKQES